MSLVRYSSVEQGSTDKLSHRNASKDVYIPFPSLIIFRPLVVRFCLPPIITELPPKSTPYRVVETQDPSAMDIPKLHQSASRWTKADLDFLGVEYQWNVFEDILSLIRIKDADVPPEVLTSKTHFITVF